MFVESIEVLVGKESSTEHLTTPDCTAPDSADWKSSLSQFLTISLLILRQAPSYPPSSLSFFVLVQQP